MKIFCLEASQPITKSYELVGEDVVKTPYPNVYELTSHEYDVDGLDSFKDVVLSHADEGHCLLKGMLHRQLVRESRAGSTNSLDKTEWVCLDLDGVTGFGTVDMFLHAIGCGDTSYILQWSSSHGLDGFATLRCHIFMMLSVPHNPEYLKRWLTTLNLTVPTLCEQLTLTKTNSSLRWVLDVTTCQNDKLLYISPPTFLGMDDPLNGGPRIELCRRKNELLTIKTTVLESAAIRKKTEDRVNDLRVGLDMPRRKTKMKVLNDVEYAVAPDEAAVTEIKHERGFVYLNLNGGDSWGYYHPADNPEFIHNFKGEPAYKTSELLPAYWIEVNKGKTRFKIEEDAEGVTYFAFRDFRSSNYYNGWYDSEVGELVLAMAKSEKQLKDFLVQRGKPVPDFIQDWDMVYEPSSPTVVDVNNKTLNIYRAPAHTRDEPYEVKDVPAVCHKIIHHVLGSDDECYEHFINWLAVVVQTRDRTNSAWMLRGLQGTGKGLLFNNILTPLMGEDNTVAKRMEELESEFTGFMANKLVVFIDEFEVKESAKAGRIVMKLKNLITEPTISIREMYRPAYMARNFASMIFSSNAIDATKVTDDDRRMNIPPYQYNKLKITTEEVETTLPSEISDFYQFLMAFPADREKARLVLENEAKRGLVAVNKTAVETVCEALQKGDFSFFWDLLPSRKPSDSGVIDPMYYRYVRFKKLLVEIIEGGVEGKIARDDLMEIFSWCDEKTPRSPNKFTALLKHNDIILKNVWVGGRSVRGIEVSWVYPSQEWVDERLNEIKKDLV